MSLSREAGGGGDAGQEIKDIHEPKAMDPIENLGPFPKIARRQLEIGDIDVDSDSEPDSDYDNIPRTSTPPKQNSPESPLVASRSKHTTSTLPSGPWGADTDMQGLKSVSSRRVKILGPFHIARCRLESGDIDVHPDSDDDIPQNRRAWGSSSARHDIRRQQKISQPPQLIECRDGPPPPRPKFGVAAAKSVVADNETREIPESSSAMKSMFLPCRTCQLRKVGGRLECEHFLNGGSICESTSSINKAEDPLVGVGRKFGVPKIVGNECRWPFAINRSTMWCVLECPDSSQVGAKARDRYPLNWSLFQDGH
ncbi:hypothetical protein BDD12DRAFT_52221 [Trichophaea hybrida]|nr:hypothetical protein BDD12DRAFT_52221 [Trichophaea hybrida]